MSLPARIRTQSPAAIEAVRRLEEETRKMPQVELETLHSMHAGMYARTITVPAGVLTVGAFIVVPTLLIVAGRGLIYMDGEPREVVGYTIVEGEAGRKQAFFALEDTHITMIFPTAAATVEEAEAEFTNEAEKLMTRIKGATPCLER